MASLLALGRPLSFAEDIKRDGAAIQAKFTPALLLPWLMTPPGLRRFQPFHFG